MNSDPKLDWTPLSLGELCSKVGSGATPRGGKNAYLPEGIALVRSQNILDLHFSDRGLARISDEAAKKLSNVTVEPGDVLLNITGDSVARCCAAPEWLGEARVNQHVMIIRPDDDRLDAKFLAYSLIAEKPKLLSLSKAGATRPALTKSMVEGLELDLPDIAEQQRIAGVLGALDKKIQLNKEIAQTLEQTAMAMFSSKFPFYADPDKTASEKTSDTSGELMDVLIQSKKPIKAAEVTSDLRYVPIDVISPHSLCLLEARPPEEAQSSLFTFSAGDFLFGAMRSYFHKVCIAPFDGVTRSTVLVLRPQTPADYSFGLLALHQEKTIDYANRHSKGSTIPYADWKSLSRMPMRIPSEDVRAAFDNECRPLLKRIASMFYEINTLTAIRDELLPKLIYGQIRVEDTFDPGGGEAGQLSSYELTEVDSGAEGSYSPEPQLAVES